MRIVVTGGGTVAPIDDVRLVITNLSSGRLATITEACLKHRRMHIHAPSAQLPFLRLARLDLDARNLDAERIRLTQLRETSRGVRNYLEPRPKERSEITRRRWSECFGRSPLTWPSWPWRPPTLSRSPWPASSTPRPRVFASGIAPKVIQSVRDWAPAVFLVGFKLLSRVSESDLIRQATSACRTQRTDVTVANDLQTLRAGRHTIHLVRQGQPAETLGPAPDLAEHLVDRVLAIREAEEPRL